MASLQAKHVRSCDVGPWTPFAKAVEGCSCPQGPLYYVVVREGGRADKIRVGRSRREAERALRKVAVTVDEGSYRPQLNLPFAAWADRWLEGLERKPTTIASYLSTMAYASEAFGGRSVRQVATEQISDLNRQLKLRGMSPSTRAKHLRVPGACFESAVAHGYAGRNPVRDLPRSEKPRPTRREAAYFTNEELPRLFAELPTGLVFTLFSLALKTGARQGELLGLLWGDVDLGEAVIRVRRSSAGGVSTTIKNHEHRDVDVTDDVVQMLGSWWGTCGCPAGLDVVVFPGESRGGYLSPSNLLRRQLYPAMERSGIPRVGPTGELRTFHSFRHTFAKRALETGAQLTWLSRHLGHSSTAITDGVYGHWERAARRSQARRLAGVFGV